MVSIQSTFSASKCLNRYTALKKWERILHLNLALEGFSLIVLYVDCPDTIAFIGNILDLNLNKMSAAQQYGASGYPGATGSIQGADTNSQIVQPPQYIQPAYPTPGYDPNADA